MIDYPLMSYDILPMQNADNPSVAVAILFKDGEEKIWHKTNKKHLFKLIRKYNPSHLGTDNPNEVLRAGQSIASFCEYLPENTKFVHINLTSTGKTISFMQLLSQFDLSFNRKPSPVETARTINLLMQKGVGMILEPFENETIIHVGRPKSHAKGGWSQARYSRQNEEVVHRVSKDIQEALEMNEFAFDKQEISTKHGAKWARFYIFHDKIQVDKVVNKISFHPAKVKIWRQKKSLITHTPISGIGNIDLILSNTKYLIVGIDPGMETGVSIIDLNGNLITGYSRKNLSRGDLISNLTVYGTPAVVAADVKPAPTFVKKIAATYHAVLWEPDRLLSQAEKKNMVTPFEFNPKRNSHIRDALAAALYAFEKFKTPFDKIDQMKDLSSREVEMAKYLIIHGYSVEESIKLSMEKSIADKLSYSEKLVERVILRDNIPELNRISNLEIERSYLLAENERQKSHIKQLQNTINQILQEKRRENQIQTYEILKNDLILDKDNSIKKLNKEVKILFEQLKRERERVAGLEKLIWKSMEGGGIPIKTLNVFSINALEQLEKNMGIENDDILLIMDATGGGMNTINKIVDIKFKMIFYEGKGFSPTVQNILHENSIPYIHAHKYDILIFEGSAIINRNNLELAIHDYLINYNVIESKMKTQRINKTLENYYHQRNKEINELEVDYKDFNIQD